MRRTLQVYLAGPITGCSYRGAVDWREFVTKELQDEFICLSPMRCKEYLVASQDIAKSYDSYEGEDCDLPTIGQILSCNKGINRRDSWDCRTADLLLVNMFGCKKVTIGSVLEIGMAWMHRKPIVCVMEPGNIHEHPMVDDMIDFRCPDLDMALAVLRSLR